MNMFAKCREIEDVVRDYLVASFGNKGVSVSLDGYKVKLFAHLHQLVQEFIDNGRILSHLGADEDHCSVTKLPPETGPWSLERHRDLTGGNQLGIDHGVDTQLLEELGVLGQQILIIVDTGKCLLCAQIGCEHTGGDVFGFFR